MSPLRFGEYEVVARLRAGGMATLYLGRRRGAAGFARPVAIKVVHPHLATDPQFVRMFVDEGLLSARINHPNVVHVEELGESEGAYFLVMEYVPGASLSQLLRALGERERRMTPAVATWIAMQVADGLHAAHETRGDDGQSLGVVHRDVSPQNVLIAESGHVKLIDFGIAKASLRGTKTSTGSLRGKIRYMAPEQAHGRSIDRRADVYALGIVLWEMLTTRRLFHADNDLLLLDKVRSPHIPAPSTFADDVPPALDRAVLYALALDPVNRPESALELRRVLADALPDAARTDAAQVAQLLGATVGAEIAREAERLPADVQEALVMSGSRRLPSPERDGDDALGTMTLSAPNAGYRREVDGGGSDDSDEDGVGDAKALRSALAFESPATPLATTTGPTPLARPAPSAAAGRDRWIAVGASVVAVAALGVAAFAVVRTSPEPAAPQSNRGAESSSSAPSSPRPSPGSGRGGQVPNLAPRPMGARPLSPQRGERQGEGPTPTSSPARPDDAGASIATLLDSGTTGSGTTRRRPPRQRRDDPSTAEPPRSLVKGVPIFDDDGL
ncbi:MAG: serine/threonine protein kinase [Deltaproteobacteria bacterium]|nr:serine/threonine protein kinase [Deltaproteobacteria bacterium]